MNDFSIDRCNINNGDTLVITPEHEVMLHRCDDCGVWHKIEIKRQENGDVHLVFFRQDDPPKFEDYDICTHIIDADGFEIITKS